MDPRTVPEPEEPVPKMQKVDAGYPEGIELNGNAAYLNNNGVEGASEPLLRVKKLSSNAILPSRGSALAAGYDLSSATSCVVPARGKALVPTDLSIAIPEGTYARIAPRSGLAWKHSIDVGAGVIDADYRGSVGVILFNHSDQGFEIKAGDRIAQLIVQKILTPQVLEVEDLDSTFMALCGWQLTLDALEAYGAQGHIPAVTMESESAASLYKDDQLASVHKLLGRHSMSKNRGHS